MAKKATNRIINQDFLNHRVQRAVEAGFTKQKWVEFCEELLRRGYVLSLYEARRSHTKEMFDV